MDNDIDMNNPASLPPPNAPPSRMTKQRKTTWILLGSIVVLLVLGLVVAAAVWGPPMLTRLSDLFGPPAEEEPPVAAAKFAAQRKSDVQQLNSYGWVDKSTDVVHIPIDQAIALIAESGLPVGVTPAPTPAPETSQAVTGAATTPAVDLAHVSFKDNVLPIFEQHCAKCHGDDRTEEGLKLIRYRTVVAGSQNGPVVVPGDPDNSYLVEMVTTGKMPKEGDPLTTAEIDIIRAWIAAGAPDN